MPSGGETAEHYHPNTEELYYFTSGSGRMRLGEDDEARKILKTGIAVATRTGDSHAAGEMAGFLESLG